MFYVPVYFWNALLHASINIPQNVFIKNSTFKTEGMKLSTFNAEIII